MLWLGRLALTAPLLPELTDLPLVWRLLSPSRYRVIEARLGGGSHHKAKLNSARWLALQQLLVRDSCVIILLHLKGRLESFKGIKIAGAIPHSQIRRSGHNLCILSWAIASQVIALARVLINHHHRCSLVLILDVPPVVTAIVVIVQVPYHLSHSPLFPFLLWWQQADVLLDFRRLLLLRPGLACVVLGALEQSLLLQEADALGGAAEDGLELLELARVLVVEVGLQLVGLLVLLVAKSGFSLRDSWVQGSRQIRL